MDTNSTLSHTVSAELDSESKLTEENAIYRHGDQFAEHLGQGLSDNWSQVLQCTSIWLHMHCLLLCKSLHCTNYKATVEGGLQYRVHFDRNLSFKNNVVMGLWEGELMMVIRNLNKNGKSDQNSY